MTLINPYIFGGGAPPPADIPTTDLQLHLRASTLGLADGAAVSSWTDGSGNGRTASQATAAKQPLYKTSIINGEPVVRFDGGDDWMSGSAWPFDDEMVFLVMSVTSAATSDGFFCRGAGGNDWNTRDGLAIEAAASTTYRGTYGLSGALADDGQATLTRPANGTFAIYEHTLNAGTQRVAYNRAAVAATDTYTTGTSTPTNYVLGTRWLSGAPSTNTAAFDLAEIDAYSTYDATRRTDALDALAARYGITLV